MCPLVWSSIVSDTISNTISTGLDFYKPSNGIADKDMAGKEVISTLGADTNCYKNKLPRTAYSKVSTINTSPAGWWGPGQSHRAPSTEGPTLGLVFCCCCLEILNNFWTQGPTFSFCTRLHKVCSQFYDWFCRKEVHVHSSKNIFYICSSSVVHHPIARAQPWLRIEGGLTRQVIPSSCYFQASTGKHITWMGTSYVSMSEQDPVACKLTFIPWWHLLPGDISRDFINSSNNFK